MWYLLENYGTDPEVTYLVDNREIYCIPCFNPDGYEYNRQQAPGGGGMWRKNRRDNGGCYGVDLNRNFGYMWGYDNIGSSPDPCASTYRGPTAFSEPESQAVRDLAIQHNYGTHFNMHAWQDAYLYPWGYINEQSPDSSTYREFASDMSAFNGYSYGTSGEILNYQSNGSVRDWMYGEQVEKNKIFGYTIEIGNSEEWFWPPQSRIFPIAQINVRSNMYHAFVAGEYVKLIDPNFSQENFLPGDNVELLPEFKNKGLATAYNLTIELSSPSGLVTVTNGSASLDSIEVRSSQTLTLPLSFTISQSAPLEEIPIVLRTWTNGNLISGDTIIIAIGFPVTVFADSTNDPTELWTITATPSNPKWEATTSTYHSSPTSFTDSKNGNYSNNATVTMTLTNPLDLTSYNIPTLIFWTQFDIENNYDYGQIEVSMNNGSTWIPLKGNYTKPGVGGSQPDLEPVYDGVISNWVKEEISLTNYKSNQFKVRFQLRSDGGERHDGWYLDDISMIIYTIPTTQETDSESIWEYSLEQNYPNPFNPSTTIKWQLAEDNFVTLKIYDILGNTVASLVNEKMEFGNHQVEFNASSLSSGIYYYKITAGLFTETKKMILLK
jgi:hypothetical protein